MWAGVSVLYEADGPLPARQHGVLVTLMTCAKILLAGVLSKFEGRLGKVECVRKYACIETVRAPACPMLACA